MSKKSPFIANYYTVCSKGSALWGSSQRIKAVMTILMIHLVKSTIPADSQLMAKWLWLWSMNEATDANQLIHAPLQCFAWTWTYIMYASTTVKDHFCSLQSRYYFCFVFIPISNKCTEPTKKISGKVTGNTAALLKWSPMRQFGKMIIHVSSSLNMYLCMCVLYLCNEGLVLTFWGCLLLVLPPNKVL